MRFPHAKALLLVKPLKSLKRFFVEIEKDAVDGGHAFQDIQGDVYETLGAIIVRVKRTV
jgi:type I restriction enzyme M protein